MLVYLAGKITGLSSKQANEWRETARILLELHGIKAHNPLDGFDIDDEYEPQEIVMRNKFYLLKSDIVIAEMQHKEPSIGTIGEVITANIHNKPIFTWGTAVYNDNPRIKAHITKHFETLEDAVDYIITMYA